MTADTNLPAPAAPVAPSAKRVEEAAPDREMDLEIIDPEDFLAVGRCLRGCLSRQVGVGCHAAGPAACTS